MMKHISYSMYQYDREYSILKQALMNRIIFSTTDSHKRDYYV